MNNTNKLQHITVQEICPTLSYSFMCTYFHASDRVNILVVVFHGQYSRGSAGYEDSLLIEGVVKMGTSLFDPSGILLDFRDMSYEWGDDLDLSFAYSPIKTVAVVGEKCRQAMSTLAFGLDSKQDIVDNESFFENIDEAIVYIENIETKTHETSAIQFPETSEVKSRESFIRFAELFYTDFIHKKENWENVRLEDFLEALIRYTEDIQGYYDSTAQRVNADNASWKVFADILMGASMYE